MVPPSPSPRRPSTATRTLPVSSRATSRPSRAFPFADAPLGDLRFKKPVPYSGTYQGLAANDYQKGCKSLDPAKIITAIDDIVDLGKIIPDLTKTPLYDTVQGSISTSEDCLYLNVLRPAGTTAADKLPVMAWIYGGAFLWGTTGQYPGNNYVAESVAMGQPVVFVSISYRLGPYGFLGGDAISEEGNTNAGLRDQRLGLEWIQEHIADFGGDPGNVMIFGESAGAMSVAHQLIYNAGDNSYKDGQLFHSAVLQSGGPLPLQSTTSRSPQAEYERFAEKCGCAGLGKSETLACLRSKDVSVLSAAENSYGADDLFGLLYEFLGFTPRPDGDIIPDDAYTLYQNNKVAPVPLIAGSLQDEGTLFAFTAYNATTTNDVRKWLSYILNKASPESINNIIAQYSALPSAGAPFDTGVLNILSLQYKRIAAIFTDLLFVAPRRTIIQNSQQKVWAYYGTFLHNLVPYLGTFHGSDLLYQWYLPLGPYKAFRRYFISFANHKDPNYGTQLSPWPQYSNSDKKILNISPIDLHSTTDNYRSDSVSYLMSKNDIRG